MPPNKPLSAKRSQRAELFGRARQRARSHAITRLVRAARRLLGPPAMPIEIQAMARSQMFRSLEHRNARLFFLGLSLSNIGSWIQMTAVSLLVYQRTGKATDVGITLLCQFLPMLVLGVWAGAIADRVDKRKMTMLTQSGQAALAILLGVLALAGVGDVAGDLSRVARHRDRSGGRQPCSPRLRHRARRAAPHLQCRVAEHRGDDRFANFRSGTRSGACAVVGTGLAVHHQRDLVRRRSCGRSGASTPRSCSSHRRLLAVANRCERRCGSSVTTDGCSCCSRCSPSSEPLRSTTACRC